ncbi:unnamed protein product [Arabidopsis halleri]
MYRTETEAKKTEPNRTENLKITEWILNLITEITVTESVPNRNISGNRNTRNTIIFLK